MQISHQASKSALFVIGLLLSSASVNIVPAQASDIENLLTQTDEPPGHIYFPDSGNRILGIEFLEVPIKPVNPIEPIGPVAPADPANPTNLQRPGCLIPIWRWCEPDPTEMQFSPLGEQFQFPSVPKNHFDSAIDQFELIESQ